MNQPVAVNRETLDHAAALLRSGGVIAFPTETYYGLAVDPFNGQALERLYRIKQRPRQLPILVLVTGPGQMQQLASEVPAAYYRLIDCFWPGPLTLVCPALPSLPLPLTGGTGTVGIRWSPHQTATGLIRAFGGPVTATSANISGQPPAVTASEVALMLGDAIDLILDGGATPGGSGSTLIGLQGNGLTCIREGKIRFSAVQACVLAHPTTT